jgi:hypothetical protein
LSVISKSLENQEDWDNFRVKVLRFNCKTLGGNNPTPEEYPCIAVGNVWLGNMFFDFIYLKDFIPPRETSIITEDELTITAARTMGLF